MPRFAPNLAKKCLAVAISLSAIVSASPVPPEKNELFVWGRNRLPMIAIRPVVGIAAGGNTSYAIQDDGMVLAWGGLIDSPKEGLRDLVKIVADEQWDVGALMLDGTFYRGGIPSFSGVMDGALRGGILLVVDSSHLARSLPWNGVWTDIVRGVKAVARTEYENWYLRDDGVVLQGKAATPRPELGLFRRITAGGWHVAGVREDGTVAVWGDSSSGQLGVPKGLSGVVDLQAGLCHTVALKNDGSVASWGLPCTHWQECLLAARKLDETRGPCWPGDSSLRMIPPAGIGKVKAIATGDFHALALHEDGTVVGWGDTSYQATRIPEGRSNVAAIEVQQDLVAVLHKDGGLSLGTSLDGTTLVWNQNPPLDGKGLQKISVAYDHVLGLDSSGQLHAWNPDGSAWPLSKTKIDASGRSVPMVFSGIADISAGEYDVLRYADGSVVAGLAQIAGHRVPGHFEEIPRSLSSRARQVVYAKSAVFLLLNDGTVGRWSSEHLNFISASDSEPPPWVGVERLIGGCGLCGLDSSNHFLVLSNDLRLNQEGYRAGHAFGVVASKISELPPLAMVAGSALGFTALDTSGRLVGWGSEYYGPWPFPPEYPRMSALAAGLQFSMGLISDRGTWYSGTKPVVRKPAFAPGAYPVHLFEVSGRSLWNGFAVWDGRSWKVPSDFHGLCILLAKMPEGMRTERIFLPR